MGGQCKKASILTFEKLKAKRAAQRDALRARSERVKSMLLQRGTKVFQKYGVRKAIVFGSVASGFSRETSDIDILVMPLENSRYWDFRHELEDAVELPIDLYTDSDDPDFVEKIKSRGEILYEL